MTAAKKKADLIESVAAVAVEPQVPLEEIQGTRELKPLVPLGSTLLNLACSDHAEGAFEIGHIINVIGGSHAGKTALVLTAAAEISNTPVFDKTDVVEDDAEQANEFDMEKLFGPKTADRIQTPRMVDNIPTCSDSIEAFKDNILRRLQGENPFIYILDSLDSLPSLAELEKAEEDMKNRDAAKDTKGTYGAAKAKCVSELLRQSMARLSEQGSSIIVVSQVRDNMQAGMFGPKEIVTGGRALEFYCSHRIWLKCIETLKSPSGLVIGSKVQAEVKKNKLTGKRRSVVFDVFYDYGIDDVGSCVDWLVTWQHWEKQAGGKIAAPDLVDQPLRRGELTQFIRDNNLEAQLRSITTKAWAEVEEDCRLGWKPRYA